MLLIKLSTRMILCFYGNFAGFLETRQKLLFYTFSFSQKSDGI